MPKTKLAENNENLCEKKKLQKKRRKPKDEPLQKKCKTRKQNKTHCKTKKKLARNKTRPFAKKTT